ncbi:MAG TPA: sensor histidine kinase [Tissierellales bacterium]|nr:sensor histidine kinase [Tissierellales bacterium]
MKFKDYIKDRALYILFYIISTILVIIIMMLDLIIRQEKLQWSNIIYAFILSFVFLIILITIDYMKKRKFYEFINYSLKDNENLEYIFSLPDNTSKEHKAFKELLINNYMIYENKLDKYRKTHKTQLEFNNRWVHQMKTPISVIKLILENEKDRNTDEASKKSYESIEEEIEKLSNGLEMALYTLRVNDFEQDFKIEEINLLEVVRNVINENKNAFIVNGIYPKIVSQEKLIVKSDKKWIKFIINQIISNSIKYSKVKDFQDKSVTIEFSKEVDKTILSIEDKGVGIPEQDIKRIFNPFFTGENGRKYLESTGMGLYLSKDICNRLGHGIEVESTEGVGTKTKITFYHGKSIYSL